MNRVIYAFNDGTKVTSYTTAQELKKEKGNYSVEYEWVEIKEKEENLVYRNTKASKVVKSNTRK